MKTVKSCYKNTLAMFVLCCPLLVLAAGGQSVNCREVLDYNQNYYTGQVSCTAYHNYTDGTTPKVFHKQLTGNAPLSTSPAYTLVDTVVINTSSVLGTPYSYITGISCTAAVPFSHTEPVMKTICDKTPYASIFENDVIERWEGNVIYYTAGLKAVSFEYSDDDGTVVSAEAWIDNIPVSISHHDLIVRTEPYQIRLKVTDDDGHVTETSKNITVRMMPQRCSVNGQIMPCNRLP